MIADARSAALAAALLTLLGGGAACSKHGTGAPQGGSAGSPARVKLQRLVEVVQVEQRPIVSIFEVVGVLEAEGQTDVAAGVSGLVDEVLFREGDAVTPGTVLVKIDQDRYESEADAARATLERAGAAAGLARDLADRALRAGFGASEEEKVKARGAVGIAEAELRHAQAAMRKATRNLEMSRVRAPYAGRINKRMVTKGSYVEEKTPLATIADLSRIRLQSFVAEKAAPTVRQLFQGQAARLAAVKATLPLGAFAPGQPPWGALATMHLVQEDYVPSGFDPEFELQALPGRKFFGRIFYMSTVGTVDTHQFEVKAEVLGWSLERNVLAGKDAPLYRAARVTFGGLGAGAAPWAALQFDPRELLRQPAPLPEMELRPGFTAAVRFPLRSNASAMVIPEEAGKWEAVRASEHGFIAFVPAMERDDRGQVIIDKSGLPQWVAQRRRLDLGFRAPGWVEVRAGLVPGEWVVRRGADTLEEGTPLQIAEPQLKLMVGR